MHTLLVMWGTIFAPTVSALSKLAMHSYRKLPTRMLTSSVSADLPRLRVVMDLDECMVSRSGGPLRWKDPLPGIESVEYMPENDPNDRHEYDSDSDKLSMLLRPGLRQFLEEVSSFADLYGFTAGIAQYARPAFGQLDPEKKYFQKIWYSESCGSISDPRGV